MACRCLDCHFLGYRREETEKARSEPGRIVLGTVHRFPESLPTETRRLFLEDDRPGVEQGLRSLSASEDQLTCLRLGSDGAPLNSELPGLRPIPEQFAAMRSSVLRERDCRSFRPVDSSLPYSVLKDLEEERSRATALDGALQRARMKWLASIRQAFLALEESALSPQARGTAVEFWLRDLLRLYDVDPVLNVVNPGEQVDVTFWFGQLFILGEVRWRNSPMDTPQVRDFFGKLHERPPFVLGLLVGLGGFTAPAIEYLSRHAGERSVLTAERADVDSWLDATPELPDWFGSRLRAKLEHP